MVYTHVQLQHTTKTLIIIIIIIIIAILLGYRSFQLTFNVFLIVSSLAVFNLSNTVGCRSAQACRLQKKILHKYPDVSRLICTMGMGRNWELPDGNKWEWDISSEMEIKS